MHRGFFLTHTTTSSPDSPRENCVQTLPAHVCSVFSPCGAKWDVSSSVARRKLRAFHRSDGPSVGKNGAVQKEKKTKQQRVLVSPEREAIFGGFFNLPRIGFRKETVDARASAPRAEWLSCLAGLRPCSNEQKLLHWSIHQQTARRLRSSAAAKDSQQEQHLPFSPFRESRVVYRFCFGQASMSAYFFSRPS